MAKERWITVNGNHVLIKEGQSVNEALAERFDGKRGKKRINGGKHEYSVDGKEWEDMDSDSYNELDADEEEFDINEDSDFENDEQEPSVEKYVPKTKVEKEVDAWIEQNWDKIDKNGNLGELAYKMGAYIRAPYPVMLDAVGKSVAARMQNEPEQPESNEEDIYNSVVKLRELGKSDVEIRDNFLMKEKGMTQKEAEDFLDADRNYWKNGNKEEHDGYEADDTPSASRFKKKDEFNNEITILKMKDGGKYKVFLNGGFLGKHPASGDDFDSFEKAEKALNKELEKDVFKDGEEVEVNDGYGKPYKAKILRRMPQKELDDLGYSLNPTAPGGYYEIEYEGFGGNKQKKVVWTRRIDRKK